MNTHFCRVGKIKPNLNKAISLKEIERTIANFVDDISKVEFNKDLNEAL
ncbi:hypothetical protein [Seonamhaeicola sp. S2-3]|nr:hypothetical protein [Seonamhaeicola sp. S2-3]